MRRGREARRTGHADMTDWCAVIDLHTHHERCGHAVGRLADVATWALAAGIEVLGVSDHAPRFADPLDHPLPLTQMARSQWDGYLREAAAVRDDFRGRLDVRVGAEVDWIPGTEAAVRAGLDRPELDYVIGSVHEVGTWNLFHPDTWDGATPDVFHERYWSEIAAAASSGLFDVLGHLDLIRARVPAPTTPPQGAIDAALDAIAAAGVAVEINGSGMRRDGRPFPDATLLAALVRRGVPITYGSDTHARDHLGMGWQEAVTSLAALGVFELVSFRSRRPVRVPLPAGVRP